MMVQSMIGRAAVDSHMEQKGCGNPLEDQTQMLTSEDKLEHLSDLRQVRTRVRRSVLEKKLEQCFGSPTQASLVVLVSSLAWR